jgi:hypothetical protein
MGRGASMQRIFVYMQNVCTNGKGEAKEDLDELIKFMPRASGYPEVLSAKRDITDAV